MIDESGLSQKPHRCRTWAPRGQTPVLEFNFNWDKLSVSAGLTFGNFYFRLYPGAIGELEVIDFLQALVRHIERPLLIVWDRLPAHRSRLVREFIELSEGHIVTEYLPPYAPELNPVEYIWAYWKQHELPNVCPKDYWELDERARKALRRMRRKHGIELLVVDYLQLITGSTYRGNNRTAEVAEISKGLKALAKELNISVIALSQLSREVEGRDDKRPILKDLRDSGSIEQDADVVMFVYRDEYYLERSEPALNAKGRQQWEAKMHAAHGKAEAIIAKNRNGPIGTMTLTFDDELTAFSDLPVVSEVA